MAQSVAQHVAKRMAQLIAHPHSMEHKAQRREQYPGAQFPRAQQLRQVASQPVAQPADAPVHGAA
eukprot:2175175-Pyramimonas_sp.AAC.1